MDQVINNKFYIDDLSCEDLTAEFGSPLYVYNGQTFRERFSSLANAFDYPKIRIYYACKSNTNINVLKIFKGLGSYVDTVSPGEIFSALKAGFEPDKLLFTPNNPTPDDMKYAVDNNVMVTIGSLPIIEEYAKLGGSNDISIRVNPDIGFGHHDHCITGGPKSKFGIYFNQMDKARELVSKHGLNIKGIHAFRDTGSRSIYRSYGYGPKYC